MIRKYAPGWLTGGGLLLLFALYMLPRWVVDNKVAAAKDISIADSIEDTHMLTMDWTLRLQLTGWHRRWQETQHWIWADSLAHSYLQYHRIDTALYYARILGQSDASAALRKGALYLYRAYDLAQDSSLAVEARTYLEAAISRYPKDYTLRVQQALTYLRSDEPMQGIRMLKALEAKAPEDPSVLFALGRLSLQTGQYQKGEEKLRKLLELYPKHVEGMLYLGRYFMQNQRLSEGQAILKQARRISTDPALLKIVDIYLKER